MSKSNNKKNIITENGFLQISIRHVSLGKKLFLSGKNQKGLI